MATANINFRCLHCSAEVSEQEIADGWCDTCGKKVPFSLQSQVKRTRTAPPIFHDAYDEPKPGSGKRLVLSSLCLSALAAAAVVAMLVLK